MTATKDNPVQTVQPYLFFGGRCEEAIEFYRIALGAEVTMLMRYKDSPDPSMCAPGVENKVMHARLNEQNAKLAGPRESSPKEKIMSRIRVLVGTRKGAFLLTSDGKREHWNVSDPHFAGWEIYHLKGSPAEPDRLFASQTSGWFGQMIQRSDDGGKTWEPVGNEFNYDGVPGTHQWYDGTQHPWEFKRVWHLEPSPSDPDTVYAGAEDAALFKTTDGGRTWQELPGVRGAKGHLWQPGRGRHVSAHDRSGSEPARAGLHRDLSGGCLSNR